MLFTSITFFLRLVCHNPLSPLFICVSDPGDPGSVKSKHVEPAGHILRFSLFQEIILCNSSDHSLLAGIYGLDRKSCVSRASIFDLHKNQDTFVECDQIDFADPAPEVLLQNDQTLLREPLGCPVLIKASFESFVLFQLSSSLSD